MRSKTMAKKKQSKLEMYGKCAQTFTVVSAVVYGAYWAITGIFDVNSTNVDMYGNILLVFVVLGGISMGLISALDSSKK